MKNSDYNNSHFDVVVCGAGLAGLSFARQLRLEQPERLIAILDPLTPPIPDAIWKVGESTVEFGSHYLAGYLQLEDYLKETQLKKLGLRFFYSSNGSMASRPEFGLSDFAEFPTYQIDRGILERDMRDMARADGTVFLEGCQVRKVELSDDGAHRIIFTDTTAGAGADGALTARWVVDATGRRQLLQRQLNLKQPSEGKACSSVWFRIPGRVDVDDMVSPENRKWHDRVPESRRYFSTNHLCGAGYWVWIIPLSSNVTSVGIVARDDIHPFDAYNTREKAIEWLKGNETELGAYLEGQEMLDFKFMKEYSYSSAKVFSGERWACVGEAALFADPFYSPGTDLIAIANTMTIDMIRRDFDGKHDAERIRYYSDYLIELNDELTRSIQHGYDYLGDETISLMRGLWDYSAAWGHLCPLLFNRAFTDEQKQQAMQPRGVLPLFVIAVFMRRLLDEWLQHRRKYGGRLTYDYVNYLGIEWLAEHRRSNLREQESLEALAARYRSNLELHEELLHAVFLIAVEDVHPEHLDRLKDVEWMNVQKLTLDPSKWESSGMFKPRTKPRPFRRLYTELRSWLKPRETELQTEREAHVV